MGSLEVPVEERDVDAVHASMASSSSASLNQERGQHLRNQDSLAASLSLPALQAAATARHVVRAGSINVDWKDEMGWVEKGKVDMGGDGNRLKLKILMGGAGVLN